MITQVPTPYTAKNQTRRFQYELIRTQLELQRAGWLDQWQDISAFISPMRSRFFATDVNQGFRRNKQIIDTTPSLASRTLQAGMMSGMTPASREWFRLTLKDLELAESGPVKDWLYTVTERMKTVFSRSNLYKVLPIIYGNLGDYGTAGAYMEEDFNDVVRFYPAPLGSFSMSNNYRNEVDTVTRVMSFTVRQLIEKFGHPNGEKKIQWQHFSDTVKSMWMTGNVEQFMEICHIIKPNEKWDASKAEAKYKRYVSCYYEIGTMTGFNGNYMTGNIEPDRYLRISGYDFFPGLFPRWELNGEDAYGTNCPGMISIGDCRQLQAQERRVAQAIEKMVNPPMKGPTSMRSTKAALLPGYMNYTDQVQGGTAFEPAQVVDPRILEVENKQAQIRNRIQTAYFTDLFLMAAASEDPRKTATEIRVREQERLMALGPMVGQFQEDCLKPLIDNTFNIMLRQGMIPPPPPDLEGQEMDVEYLSIFAEAQKAMNAGGIEGFMSFALQTAQINPESLDKVNTDEMFDVYGAARSIPPGVIRSDEETAMIRDQRRQMMQQQQAMAMAAEAAQAAKNLSQAPMDQDSALTQLTGQQ